MGRASQLIKKTGVIQRPSSTAASLKPSDSESETVERIRQLNQLMADFYAYLGEEVSSIDPSKVSKPTWSYDYEIISSNHSMFYDDKGKAIASKNAINTSLDEQQLAIQRASRMLARLAKAQAFYEMAYLVLLSFRGLHTQSADDVNQALLDTFKKDLADIKKEYTVSPDFTGFIRTKRQATDGNYEPRSEDDIKKVVKDWIGDLSGLNKKNTAKSKLSQLQYQINEQAEELKSVLPAFWNLYNTTQILFETEAIEEVASDFKEPLVEHYMGEMDLARNEAKGTYPDENPIISSPSRALPILLGLVLAGGTFYGISKWRSGDA